MLALRCGKPETSDTKAALGAFTSMFEFKGAMMNPLLSLVEGQLPL